MTKQLDALATMGEGLKKRQKTPRQRFDLYETPEAITNDLLNSYSDWFGCLYDDSITIFEPCVGNGAILNPIKKFYEGGTTPLIVTNDIQKGLGQYWMDATEEECWSGCWKDLGKNGLDFVITNPPYNQAFEILTHAQKYARTGVILLLRLSFLEPTKKRGKWLQAHPPTFIRVYGSPRPKFTEPSTDTVTTAWMGWLNDVSFEDYYNPISFAREWK